MLQFALALLQLLPRFFVWLVAPVVLIAIVLTFVPRTRPRAALGFIVAAAISASFLSLETAALALICCDQARLIFSLLLDLRPGVTAGFVASLLGNLGTPLVGLLPMLVAAICTSLCALALRRKPAPGRNVLQEQPSTA